MNFDISKEEWKQELRSKSPIYAAYDENKNICNVKKKVEENDTDTDSGLTSLDGDTPRDRLMCSYLLDHEILLLRQDSGVSSENSDILSPCLRSRKDEQVFSGTMTTKNKTLTRTENAKQVEVKGLPAFGQYYHSRKQNSQNTIPPQSSVESNNSKCIKQNFKRTGHEKDKLLSEKFCLSNKQDGNINRKHCADGGQSIRSYNDAKKHMTERRYDCHNYSLSLSYLDSSNNHLEIVKEDKNNNNTEKMRETRTIEGTTRKLTNAKSVKGSSKKSQNLIVRDELCESYREIADKIAETVDQLLYKDLMCAYLTEEILNFSNNNFTIEEEMLDLEEKFLENQIFNSVSLLQTLESITEHQEVELKITMSENRRVDIDIKERLLKLQYMERAFRNMKFKHAPKQLKRYCSVESLLSDKDLNEFEKKKLCDQIWPEIEEFREEISLV